MAILQPTTPGPDRRTRRWPRWGLVLLAWTGVAFIFATQNYIVLAGMGQARPWLELLVTQIASWWVWAFLTGPVVAVSRRVPSVNDRPGAAAAGHLAAAAAFALVGATIEGAVRHLLPWYRGRHTLADEVQLAWRQFLDFDLLIYFLIAGVAGALAYARVLREREVREAQLHTQLVQAQLDVLAMQLQPHFLFNTLHAIAGLVEEDPRRAAHMLARLGDLLRYSMQRERRTVVPLAEELEFLEHYVAIQEARFDERLRVVFDVGAGTTAAAVPPLLLQPLVENAIQHGVARRATRGTITVSAQRHNGTLALAVCDDGPGLPLTEGRLPHEGIGLANTRARLQQLYADAHRFEWRNGAGGGAELRIELPYRAYDGGS
ncbi:MAG TPA: histidine kinase [Gemmatimonadaceae bacterium]|nr:histidine kinase [Gemmatimonadaceae bacterium]